MKNYKVLLVFVVLTGAWVNALIAQPVDGEAVNEGAAEVTPTGVGSALEGLDIDWEQLEADAVARQNANRELALKAVPFISGLSLHGLDPESPGEASMLVMVDGGVMLVGGTVSRDGDSVSFAGTRTRGSGTNPINRVVWFTICKWMAVSAVLGWPFVAFVLRGTLHENDKYDPTAGSRFFRFVGWVANLLVLAVMSGLFLLAIRRPALWMDGPNLHLQHVAWLTAAAGVALALGLLGSVVAWSRGYWRIPGRIHYTLSILCGIGFLWYLHQSEVLMTLLEQIRA